MDACRIELIGESNLSDWQESEIIRQRNNRKLYNIKPVQLNKNGVDRYIIGYINILYTDSKKIGIENCLKEQSLKQLAQQQDELDTLDFLQKYSLEIEKSKRKQAQIGLIDRMYVDQAFRGNRIGGWMLDNITDIVEFYSKVKLDALVLEAGDFANEAETQFKMSREQYVTTYLEKFYSKHGFKKYRSNSLQGILNKEKNSQRYDNYMIRKI